MDYLKRTIIYYHRHVNYSVKIQLQSTKPGCATSTYLALTKRPNHHNPSWKLQLTPKVPVGLRNRSKRAH